MDDTTTFIHSLKPPNNKPLHTEPRAARFGEINVVRRGPVNGGVRRIREMSHRKIAVIAVDQEDEVASFYAWLARNRAHVFAISENKGCGCCVDMFDLELEDGAEPMPCEADGEFDAASLRFEQERDAIISAVLEYRLNAEPSAAPNGGPAASVDNSSITEGPRSVS